MLTTFSRLTLHPMATPTGDHHADVDPLIEQDAGERHMANVEQTLCERVPVIDRR